MKKRCYLDILIITLTITICIALPSCQNATTKTLPSFDEWLRTPIPEETLQVYKDNIPIENEIQAVIAARAKLLTSRIQPHNDPRVVSVEFISSKDAIIRMQAKESGQFYSDEKVWLINFEGDFTFSDPAGTEESFFGNVYVMLSPNEGTLVTWKKIEQSYPYPTQVPNIVDTPIGYPLPYSNQQAFLTSTPTSNFSGGTRISLKQAALTNDDIPYSSDPLYSFFIDPQITPTDNSRELIDLCGIDCVKKVWANTSQRRGFVIVMYQVSDASQAKNKVEETFTHSIEIFGTDLITGTVNLPELPPHSWTTASNSVKGLVGDLITLQTSWGPIVVTLSEQGDIKPGDIPLDDYFLAIQRLAVLQLDKLKSAGYVEQ